MSTLCLYSSSHRKTGTCAIVRNNQVGGYVRRSGWTVTSADDGRISAELRRDSRVRAAGLQSATVSGTLTCAESFILCLANTTQTNQCPSHSRMHIYTSTVTVCTVFATRFYASTKHGLSRHAVSVCGPFVTFVAHVKTNKHIFKIFAPSGSYTILVFLYQKAWRYSDGNPLNRGIECRWGWQKLQFWAYIWLDCLLLMLQWARCCQHDAAGPTSRKLWHLSLVVSSAVLIADKDNKMFITRSLNVTPKTTEQRI